MQKQIRVGTEAHTIKQKGGDWSTNTRVGTDANTNNQNGEKNAKKAQMNNQKGGDRSTYEQPHEQPQGWKRRKYRKTKMAGAEAHTEKQKDGDRSKCKQPKG